MEDTETEDKEAAESPEGLVDEPETEAAAEDENEAEPAEKDAPEGEDAESTEEDADDSVEPEGPEVVIEGEEAPPQPKKAAGWVKDLRRQIKEEKRRARELQERLDAMQTPKAPEPPTAPMERPTLEAHDYDEDAYGAAMDAWYANKARIEKEAERKREEEAKLAAEWGKKRERYQEKKTSLGARDFEDAETACKNALDLTQQGLIMEVAIDPAQVVYALGKYPKRLQELAAEKNYPRFIAEVARLETKLKITTKTKAPPPETRVKTAPASSGAKSRELERLRAEAAKTGDLTAVIRYKAANGIE